MHTSSCLIVGSDGQVGSALVNHLQRVGMPVMGTTRRPERVDSSHIYLDLHLDFADWRPPVAIGVAVIAAAVTKLDACRNDPLTTREANVSGTVQLVHQLVHNGAFVVFLSSNSVFDGSVPFVPADHPHSPVTEYGRQKALVEASLADLGASVGTVRFTKILGTHVPLFRTWTHALLKGEIVHPFSDMYFSPVPLDFAVSVLTEVAKRRLPGITQVSGEKDVSYAQTAIEGAVFLGVDPALVKPIPATQSNIYVEALPRYTTLAIDRLRSELNLVPPPVSSTISEAFGHARQQEAAASEGSTVRE